MSQRKSISAWPWRYTLEHERKGLTRVILPSVYNASMFPKSAACCNRSTTLIALLVISSSRLRALCSFLSFLAINILGGHTFWKSLTPMRMALENGPCP